MPVAEQFLLSLSPREYPTLKNFIYAYCQLMKLGTKTKY